MFPTPDKISIVKSDGKKINDIRALVQPTKIFIADGNLPIEEGDTIERILPSGLLEEYSVLDRGFYSMPQNHFQVKVRKKSSLPPQNQTSPTTIYQIGNNAKVNIGSKDQSTNIVNKYDLSRFEDIKKELMNQISDDKEREICVNSLNDLKASVGKKTYNEKYQQFIATVANHMAIISPFIPYLTQLLPK
jgi:hypothetical protein